MTISFRCHDAMRCVRTVYELKEATHPLTNSLDNSTVKLMWMTFANICILFMGGKSDLSEHTIRPLRRDLPSIAQAGWKICSVYFKRSGISGLIRRLVLWRLCVRCPYIRTTSCSAEHFTLASCTDSRSSYNVQSNEEDAARVRSLNHDLRNHPVPMSITILIKQMNGRLNV